MKIIRFIFCMYILFLAVHPCNDQEICVDERKTGISVVDSSKHEHSSTEMDFCTPFCTCSCCAASIQLQFTASIDFVPPIHNTAFNTPYFEKPLLNNIKSIWQPPKIS